MQHYEDEWFGTCLENDLSVLAAGPSVASGVWDEGAIDNVAIMISCLPFSWHAPLSEAVPLGEAREQEVANDDDGSEDLTWLFEAFAAGREHRPSTAELATFIGGVNALIRDGHYRIIENIFRSSLKSAPSQCLLALARATFPVRTRLSGWKTFLDMTTDLLSERGKDVAVLLKGML
jgi:hypothetical protein